MNLGPWPTQRKQGAPRRWDCGSFGMLTVREIAERARIGVSTVHSRIAKGVRGEELAAPRMLPDVVWQQRRRTRRETHTYAEGLHIPTGVSATIYVACCVAKRFAAKTPSVADLMTRYSMSRATAYRWISAWRYASGANLHSPTGDTET